MRQNSTLLKLFVSASMFISSSSLSLHAQVVSTPPGSTCSYSNSACADGVTANFNDGDEGIFASNGFVYNVDGYYNIVNVESNRNDYSITSEAFLSNSTTVRAGADYSGDGTDDLTNYTLNILDAVTNTVLVSCAVTLNADFNPAGGSVCHTITNDNLTGRYIRFQLVVATDDDASGAFILDNFRTNLPVATVPLPVTFVGFDADKTEAGIVLTWKVASELNVKNYAIEKSIDGRNFTAIGSVKATNSNSYSFTDAQKGTAVVYYRIKNADHDGKFKYSTILRVDASTANAAKTLRVYPTPAQEQITLEHKKLNSNTTITINTMDGRAVKTVTPVRGSSVTPVSLSGIPKGIYLIRLNDGQGNIETTKLIKQ